MITTNVCDK